MRGRIITRHKPGKEGKLGKERYTVVLQLGLDAATGKRKQRWIAVKGNKKDAERELVKLLNAQENGVLVKPGRTTVAQFLEKWLRDYAAPNLAPRTAEGYAHMVRRHISPGLGSIVLTALTPGRIQAYYADKLSNGRRDGAGGLSGQTIRHHHTCLHRALETAVEWQILVRNPADAARPPHVQRHEMQVWNEDEIVRFLDAAKGTEYFALFYLVLFTGMRRSELLGLRWCDVDLLLCQLSVTRSLHVLKGGKVVIQDPKSAKGKRMVSLSPSAAQVLRQYREYQESVRIQTGSVLQDTDYVFSHANGKPLRPDSVSHAWTRLVRSAGLKAIRFHDARHSHASLMLKQGAHPKIVQERLGHSSIGITLDTYSHVAPGLQEAAANRFDDAFTNRYNEAANEKQTH